MLNRKYLIAGATVVLGCLVGLSLPVSAQRGGGGGDAQTATATGRGGRGAGRGGTPGTRISATYKGLTTNRAYQPMPTTSLADDGKVVTTTHPAIHVEAISEEVRSKYNINPFYSKTLNIRGVQIIGSDKVSDWAFLEAAYTLDHQFMNSPKWITDGFASTKIRLSIIAAVEYTMDLPENNSRGQNSWPADAAYQDTRSRGLGGMPWCSCAEENLLTLRNDPYGGPNGVGGENITIHEFSHTTASMIGVLQGNGQRQGGPFWTALRHALASANSPGTDTQPAGHLFIWNRDHGRNGQPGNVYASTNEQEYWAEGAQAWFNNANPGNSGGLSVRDDVKTKDPELAALLKEVYGDGEWRYFKTIQKKPDGTPMRPASEMAHLEGLDAVRPQMPVFNFNNSPRLIDLPGIVATRPEMGIRGGGGNGGNGGRGGGGGAGGRGGRGNATATSAPATTLP
jgi:hypothetical protein